MHHMLLSAMISGLAFVVEDTVGGEKYRQEARLHLEERKDRGRGFQEKDGLTKRHRVQLPMLESLWALYV